MPTSPKLAASTNAMDSQRNMLFVSHATPEDNEFARWLALQLGKEGFPVWCDQTKLLGGEPFWEEIEDAIRNRTRRFLFVQSRNSNQKDGCLDELAVAKTIGKQLEDTHFITAIRIDDLPFAEFNIRLHKLNSVDCAQNCWWALSS
jgi:TIR domain.